MRTSNVTDVMSVHSHQSLRVALHHEFDPVPIVQHRYRWISRSADAILIKRFYFSGALPGRHFVPALCYPEQRILLGEPPWQQQGPSLRVGTMDSHFISSYKEANVPV
jgi:hypothetical protein